MNRHAVAYPAIGRVLARLRRTPAKAQHTVQIR